MKHAIMRNKECTLKMYSFHEGAPVIHDLKWQAIQLTIHSTVALYIDGLSMTTELW